MMDTLVEIKKKRKYVTKQFCIHLSTTTLDSKNFMPRLTQQLFPVLEFKKKAWDNSFSLYKFKSSILSHFHSSSEPATEFWELLIANNTFISSELNLTRQLDH